MSDLNQIFRDAVKIVQELPTHLQAAAFAYAVEELLGESSKPTPSDRLTQSTKRSHARAEKNDREKKTHEVLRPVASGLTPKAAILWLVETGFLTEAKTGRAAQEYLQQKRGYHLDTDSLRKALLRLVREDVLERDKNDTGEYVYKTAATHASAASA